MKSATIFWATRVPETCYCASNVLQTTLLACIATSTSTSTR